MGTTLNRKAIGNEIFFSHLKDTKFIHNTISVTIWVPLTEGKSAVTALVPYVLRMGCGKYPDMLLLERKLSSLYGAVMDADVIKSGDYQLLTLSVTGVDDRFSLDDESISKGCTELLTEVLFHPLLEKNGFKQSVFELEQQSLIDSISAEINDKRSLALRKCLFSMYKGTRYAIPRYGSLEEAKAVSAVDVYERYLDILKSCHMEFFFSGCGDSSYAESIIKKSVQSLERNVEKPASEVRVTEVLRVNEITEEWPMEQCKMVLGFRLGSYGTAAEKRDIRLMAALLGGSTGSRLFTRVREKLGTCYYCSAKINVMTGIMYIECGLDENNIEITKQAILNQIKDLSEGNISDEEFEQIKRSMASALKSLGDSLGRQEGFYMNCLVQGNLYTPEEDLKGILAVTKDETAAAAKALQLDTVLILKAVKGGRKDE